MAPDVDRHRAREPGLLRPDPAPAAAAGAPAARGLAGARGRRPAGARHGAAVGRDHRAGERGGRVRDLDERRAPGARRRRAGRRAGRRRGHRAARGVALRAGLRGHRRGRRLPLQPLGHPQRRRRAGQRRPALADRTPARACGCRWRRRRAGGHRPAGGRRGPPHRAAPALDGSQQGAAGHLRRLRQVEQLQGRRRQVAQAAAVAQGRAVERDHDRHRVGGVGGVRRAVRLEHVLGVAVVGGHDRHAARAGDGVEHPSQLGVDRLDGPDHGRDDAGVADHVGVGEVDHDEAEAAAGQRRHDAVGERDGAHLGLQVVRRDVARRGHQQALLGGVLGLAPAVEEVGHVRVLLGLGGVQLRDPGRLQDVGQHRVGPQLAEGDGAGLAVVVPRHRRQRDQGRRRAAVEAVERRIGQGAAHLAGAVGPEVEEHELVAGGDRGRRGRPDDGRGHELVRDAGGVGRAHGRRRAGHRRRLAAHHAAPVALRALPAPVAVHGVDAAADGADGRAGAVPLPLQRREQPRRLVGRDVAPVGDGVDADLPHLPGQRHAHQRAQVVDVRVHAAVGDQAHQVQRSPGRAGAVAGRDERRVLGQRAVGHGRAEPHQVLRHDAPGAEVQVADLGVAHLAGRQADVVAGGGDAGVRPAPQQAVEHGRGRPVDGVAGAGRGQAPAVEHDQHDGPVPGGRAHGAAARAIASSEPASSEAPPTSAPSTSGWAISSPALSAFTEPP